MGIGPCCSPIRRPRVARICRPSSGDTPVSWVQRPRVADGHLADCYPDHYPRHRPGRERHARRDRHAGREHRAGFHDGAGTDPGVGRDDQVLGMSSPVASSVFLPPTDAEIHPRVDLGAAPPEDQVLLEEPGGEDGALLEVLRRGHHMPLVLHPHLSHRAGRDPRPPVHRRRRPAEVSDRVRVRAARRAGQRGLEPGSRVEPLDATHPPAHAPLDPGSPAVYRRGRIRRRDRREGREPGREAPASPASHASCRRPGAESDEPVAAACRRAVRPGETRR